MRREPADTEGSGGAEQTDAEQAMRDVLDAGGWESGNSIVFVFDDDSEVEFELELNDRLCDLSLSPGNDAGDVVVYISVVDC